MHVQEQELLLQIKDLRTSFRIEGKYHAAVDGINLDIHKDEVFAIVGESGSGKSATALSITQLHNMNFTRIEGDVIFDGTNLAEMNDRQLNKVRGKDISMIFQDPLTALNPLLKVGFQIEEPLVYHTNYNAAQRKSRAIELLTAVGMVNPELTYNQLPHELSGGMRQRAMIAVSLACNPKLVIADEPTTALDVTIQAQILDLLRKLQKEMKSSIILITHDLGVVAEMADRVAVMYAGQIVEVGTARQVFKNPSHPYTRSLLASIPNVGENMHRLNAIQGVVPSIRDMEREGCRFSHRIPWMSAGTHEAKPTYHEISPGHKVLCTCYQHFYFENETRKEGDK
ncbi:MAG: ABC transporter ATP-binding protein [Defluviitaleaceae bacterium]|nr:ABC transporter ATP-binding protein [Defluviitaleaceae bacterium]